MKMYLMVGILTVVMFLGGCGSAGKWNSSIKMTQDQESKDWTVTGKLDGSIEAHVDIPAWLVPYAAPKGGG